MSRESRSELVASVIRTARASEAATARFDALAATVLGLNRTDAHCLGIVDNEGGSIAAGRLAEQMGLTTAAITAVIDRLEAKGYAERVRDDADRRRVFVTLTPKLRERAERIWGPFGVEVDEMFKAFTREELLAVRRFFEMSGELHDRHVERLRALAGEPA